MICESISQIYFCLFLLVFFHNAIPFVGFGFLDNAIMIAAVSCPTLGFRVTGCVRI